MPATSVITDNLKAAARRLGFSLVGACPAVAPPGYSRFRDWLAAGYAGEMRYLPDRAAAYEHPRHVLEGVRSVLMLAMNYHTVAAPPVHAGAGRVARYAWGAADYHDVIHKRLQQLADFLRCELPSVRVRGVVDTAPLLEREFAQLAGLGWIGKNTLLLNTAAGSWFFLAALLTDAELAYDEPYSTDHCGTCRACLDACPTGAFPQPYVLDATKCISYLTIELRGSVPDELRLRVGDWLFGCDICQEVCPWNHRAPTSDEPAFAPLAEMSLVELCALFELDDDAFRSRFRHTPLWRPKRRGLLRNAALVLGNQRPTQALSALTQGLRDAESMVRAACAWALGRFELAATREVLQERWLIESDPMVRHEIESAQHSPAALE